MEQSMEWGSNAGEPANEVVVVISKSQKGLGFFHRLWGRPIKHCRYLSQVHAYNPLPHNVSEEFNFRGTKGAFRAFSFQLMLT